MFKSILLATDGSAHAKRAAAMAADIAATYKARLTLVTVLSHSMLIEDVEAAPQARRLPRAARDEMKRIHQILRQASETTDADIHAYIPSLPSITHALGEAILDEAEAAAKRRKVGKITRVIAEGDVAPQILKQITKAKADLVVMGTRGLSNFRGILIGGVSNKVIHNARCPCLTVK